MIEWLAVISLLVVAIILIVAELIFVPGTTVVGLMGVVCMIIGIYLSFDYFGNQTGWIVLMTASLVGFGAVVYGLRTNAWKRFALTRTNKSKVNEDFQADVSVGQIGKALSTMRPVGKAEFDDQVIEVHSLGNYINVGEAVKIINLKDNKVFVEPYSG
jgi:membrane-bound ClpP family serine protease